MKEYVLYREQEQRVQMLLRDILLAVYRNQGVDKLQDNLSYLVGIQEKINELGNPLDIIDHMST